VMTLPSISSATRWTGTANRSSYVAWRRAGIVICIIVVVIVSRGQCGGRPSFFWPISGSRIFGALRRVTHDESGGAARARVGEGRGTRGVVLPFDGGTWLVKEGVLHESRLTLTTASCESIASDPRLLQSLDVSFEYVPVQGDPDVEPDQSFLLTEYQQLLGEGAFQIPSAALSCIRAPSRLASALIAYNLAFCHLGQQRAVDALRFVEEAIEADPTMAEARALRTEIRAILRDEAAA
jgi:hypothetical protein